MATFNYSKIKEKWTKKNIQKSKQEELLRRIALEKAKKVALFLKNHYQVTCVYLYGSLVWGKHYTSISDIDLMIEGFPPDQRYYRALAQLPHPCCG